MMQISDNQHFRVGQKVVCISGGTRFRFTWANYPEKGEVYTIRDKYNWHGRTILLLVGISNKTAPDGLEFGFGSQHFRPIVSRPTSIEFAHEILRSVSAPTKERAHV